MAVLRGLAAAVLLAATLCALASPASASSSSALPDSEREVKAAFLYNFAKFVEWPPGTFANASSPMTLCVLGDEPLAASLQTTVKGETLNKRRFQVRRLRDPEQVRGCHILFVSPGRGSEVLGSLRGTGVLTVGGDGDFLDRGGVIRLFLEQNKMRFDVNLEAAEKGHLKLSSKLLQLARAVISQRKEG